MVTSLAPVATDPDPASLGEIGVQVVEAFFQGRRQSILDVPLQ